jgi:ribose transport system ATP-binding protein
MVAVRTPVPSALLVVRGVSKAFAGVAALSDVSLTLAPGEVHALIGENGAGKSTLIHVLTGALAADGGSLLLQDAPFAPASPAQASERGVAVVHQEPQLVGSLSALDNLFVGKQFPNLTGLGRWLINRAAMSQRAAQACAALGLSLPLAALVADLSVTQRTQLALVRCLMSEPHLLILDEPTAALTSTDAQQLLSQVDALRQRGKAVLYVSHRLDEVLQIADRITVLRNGAVVATVPAQGQTPASLIAAMSGQADAHSAVPNLIPVQAVPASTQPASTRTSAVLEVKQASSADGKLRNASLTLHAGELLGLYGLAGSGRTELLELLLGLRAGRVDALLAQGQPVHINHPQAASARGWVLIPEDRRGHALVLNMRLRDNLTLPFLQRFANARGFGWLSLGREREAAVAAMQGLSIKATGPEQSVVELSGGNQQKVVFARALAMNAKVLLCDEPTQAVDVTTRRAIHQLLREHCARGGAALVVSSDLTEMLELAQRVVVLREGVTVANLEGAQLNAPEVLRWCFDAAPDRAVTA